MAAVNAYRLILTVPVCATNQTFPQVVVVKSGIVKL